MRKIFKHDYKRVVFNTAAVLAILVLCITNVKYSSSETIINSCVGLSMNVTTATASGGNVSTTALSGEADVNITTPAVPQINQIIVLANEKPIGQAQPSGTNGWIFKWVTTLWPTGNYNVNLAAKAIYSDGRTCPIMSSINPYYMTPQQPSILSSVAQPTTLEGFVNSTQLVKITSSLLPASSPLNSLDISPYAIYVWNEPKIGKIFNPTNTFLDVSQKYYMAGATAGSDIMSVRVIYGGVEIPVTIPINVKTLETTYTSPDAIPSNQTPTQSETGVAKPNIPETTTTTPTTTATTATQVTSSQVQVSTVAKTCIESEITANRYTDISSGEATITATELDKTVNCFATSKYVLPSNFSPVDPMKIETLTVDNTVASISKLENVTKTVDSIKKDTLKISGKAKPNTTVIIYVYSDPLIITTTSDKDGNWQYTLEDPLEPGKHEVYAVVNKGDGTYKRSDPLSFLISTAGATAANPNGLSLKLGETPIATANPSNSNLVYYVVGSVCALTVSLVSLFVAIRIHLKHKPKPMTINDAGNLSTANVLSNVSVNEPISNQSATLSEPSAVAPSTPLEPIEQVGDNHKE